MLSRLAASFSDQMQQHSQRECDDAEVGEDRSIRPDAGIAEEGEHERDGGPNDHDRTSCLQAATPTCRAKKEISAEHQINKRRHENINVPAAIEHPHAVR